MPEENAVRRSHLAPPLPCAAEGCSAPVVLIRERKETIGSWGCFCEMCLSRERALWSEADPLGRSIVEQGR